MFKNDKKHLPFGHSAAVLDQDCMTLLESYRPDFSKILFDKSIVDQFCEKYFYWILSSCNHNVIGLADFKYKVYSLGTTEAFDKFYMKNQNRRFRCFKTEYMYHELAWKSNQSNWAYIEDKELKENDAVVISLPFSDTGNQHFFHNQILSQCNQLGIPVLLDLCYFSISTGINIDLTYPCITDVVFSLSKVFPVAHARIGMRLTRFDNDDTLFVYQKNFYNNRIGAALGLEFISRFSCDYIPKKYKSKQLKFCKMLGIEPSKTVLFGIAFDCWNEYNRGGLTNRLSLHNFLTQDTSVLKGIIDGSSVKQ